MVFKSTVVYAFMHLYAERALCFPEFYVFKGLKVWKKKTEWHEQTLDMYSIVLFSLQVVSDSFATPWIVARQAPLS